MREELAEFRREMGARIREAIVRAAPRAPNQERRRILELNQAARQAQVPVGHLDCMSVFLQIPPLDYAVLIRRFPELDSPDAEIQSKAWDKFAADPRSEKYRVRRNDGKTNAQIRRGA